ncbi:P-loop containing nucleoside triphosphate hydrolase protein [Xylariomycetidae sp. FL2044]|nr:P-loop containing nucleoside triphosphate hydrolase protein [Xylariomycetidae sp. FL2044]
MAHPAFLDIGKRQKGLNDHLGSLQKLGLQNLVTLPELVLVGDQSSGKSSLMSAIARLDLPRSSGICTRCPFHIHLSSTKDAQWSCTVYIQQEYDFVAPPRGRQIKKSDVTANNPFPPWSPRKTMEIKHFKTIYEQDSVAIEEVLRWAQVAVLSPSQSHEAFIPDQNGKVAYGATLQSARENTEAMFSPNVIALELKGKEYPDLSFYDLPGILAAPEREEHDYLVKVVRNMTRHFISRKEAIIMWALPMDQDAETSNTLGIIRDMKATDRTIGIITKADKLNARFDDDRAKWLATLEGKKQTVGHGFFVTSLPSGQALDSLVKWEEEFFHQGTSPWPVAFNRFANRYGVDCLRVYMANQLSVAFSRSLPSIQATLQEHLENRRQQLARLPELPANVEHQVRLCLMKFYSEVRAEVTNSEFDGAFKELYRRFFICIKMMKPKWNESRSAPAASSEVIEISDSDHENAGSPTTRSKRQRSEDASTPRIQPKRQRREAAPVGRIASTTRVKREQVDEPGTPRSNAATLASQSGDPFFQYHQRGLRLNLHSIRRDIVVKSRQGFDIVPVEVHENLILQAIRRWQGPLDIFIDRAIEIVSGALNKALQSSLQTFRQRLIYKESEMHLKDFVREQASLQRARLQELLVNECYKPMTINEETVANYKTAELQDLERLRILSRLKELEVIDDFETNPKRLTTEAKKKEKELITEYRGAHSANPYRAEMAVAATVMAYYLTAGTRFVDSVIMDVNARAYRACREDALDNHLEQKLGLSPYPSK